MKKALAFALGVLGWLALANRRVSGARLRRPDQKGEGVDRPRTRRMRLRHGNDDGLLDLNSATLFELKELHGIDETLADRIIENRPYTTKIDLIGRRVVPDSAYEAIKNSITVRHAA